MTQYTLVESDYGALLDLEMGDVVVLRLIENPVMGRRWRIVETTGFALEADDFTRTGLSPVDNTGLGERALRFKAAEAGPARIEVALKSAGLDAGMQVYVVSANIH